MRYSSNYGKLYKDRYTTVRRYSKGKVGDIVPEVYPNGRHSAKIISVERKTLNELTDKFLIADTDCENRQDAIDLLQSFYPKPIDHAKERLFVYYLEKLPYYENR